MVSGGGTQPMAAVQSVDRAVTVLEILARDGDVGVTDLAQELDVHKSTAFRIVSVLEDRGLVEQDGRRGKYRLGAGVLLLAGARTARTDLVQASRQVTEQLATELGETINVTVLAGSDALYVDQVEGTSALRSYQWVGQRFPLHCTSNGKVFLAFAEPAQREELMRPPLKRFTRRTITGLTRLRAELADVREHGYATAAGELENGLVAVAAPIHGADGGVVASLSVSGPEFRLTPERLPALGRRVRRAADQVSARLGWPGALRATGTERR